jgi:hypothetical protein
MIQALEQRWPGAELHHCEWHLQHALERLLAKEARRTPNEELAELRGCAEGARRTPLLAAVRARGSRHRE